MRQNNRCLINININIVYAAISFRRAQVLGLLVIEALFSTILMKENILPGAVPEFQNIRFLQFIISLTLNPCVVQVGSVRRSKIDDVGQDLVHLCSILSLFANKSVLEDSMLFAGTWVIDGEITHFSVSAHQIGGLPVKMQRRQGFFPLEDVESPPSLRNPCFRGFAILDHHSVECVCVLCQSP